MSLKAVERVDAAFPYLLRWNTGAADVEFLQRLCAEPEMRAAGYGLLSKHPPEHCFQMPNGAFVAVDVVVKPNGERFDVIKSGDDHPRPGGIDWRAIPPSEWRPSNVYVDIRQWPIYDSGTPHETDIVPAMLGLSNFPLIRALKDYPEQTWPSLRLADNELENECERVFCDLEGLDHGNPDPWLIMGCDIRDPQWPGDFRRMMDVQMQRKKVLHLTMYGGRNHAQGQSQQQRNNDTLVAALDSGPYWSQVALIEVANEPITNHWTYGEVRAIGTDLAAKVAGRCKMTLGSPELAHAEPYASNEAQKEDAERFYLPAIPGITDITYHVMRDLNSVWSDPFAFNFILPQYRKINGEDFGPGASTGGDVSDPVWLQNRYKRASAAGWWLHHLHTRWGVFHGRPAPQYAAAFPEKTLGAHANIVKTMNALREYRYGGAVPTLKPRDQFAAEFADVDAFYADQMGLKRPGGMVIDTATPVRADVVAMEQWGYDLMAGATPDEVKHQICQSDEWKVKHPGEQPPF